MTKKIYLTEPDKTEFEARIQKMNRANKTVVLDSTAFYATGGGQPCDLGTLKIGDETYQVLDVYRMGGDVFHVLDKNPPEGSDRVIGMVDAKRRALHSRVHTSLHLVNAVVFTKFEGALVTGGQVNSDGTGRMDFQLPGVLTEQIKSLEETVNRIVKEDREVRILNIPYEKAMAIPGVQRTAGRSIPTAKNELVRVVEIAGLDRQACGGTHTSSTGAIGQIRLVKIKSKGRNNRRVYIAIE